MNPVLIVCALLVAFASPVLALAPIAEKTAGLQKLDGYFPLYWDAAGGRLWLEISRFDEEFLYYPSLVAGLGSNDVGLDRGQLGEERVVRFERVGPKVLLVAPNLRYRAMSDNPAERRAVRESFAEGVLWGFTAAAETNGRVLVDATDFVVRDAHGIIERLKRSKQGTFKVEPQRSAVYLAGTKSFPENTEMEARVTLTGDEPGEFVREVASEPQAVTLQVHQSFVKLPPPGYQPRVYDPRFNFIAMGYADYASPVGTPLQQRFITRHRLEKRDPTAAQSEPVKPIVYYLDPGAPEPVRGALLEGARWWAVAFEAAGFKNAFRVEMLPEGADPLDIRYNVISWVHRSTRGWSYGGSVTDPRTGEIIKGKVTLGSLRVRQDYLIAEGRLSPYATSVPAPAGDPMLRMALDRLKQLSAHEVGHTLGLLHNFAASVSERASVMDYPAPLVTLGPDRLPTLAKAYASGIGAWDALAIRYGYGDTEPAALIAEARRRGLRYLSDQDGRGAVGAQPFASTWDNGSEPLAALKTEMEVRRVALERFGLNAIRPGQPLATLAETLVPLYLGHRYQAIAASKLLGGVDYAYVLRSQGEPAMRTVSGDQQRAALAALLDAVSPAALRLPAAVRKLLPPRPPGYPQTRELFEGYTGQIFDVYAPAEVAVGMVFDLLTDPERAARIAYQKDFDARLPGYAEVLEQVSMRVWRSAPAPDPYDASLQRIGQQVWLDALFALAAREKLALPVRAAVYQHLRDLETWLARNGGTTAGDRAFRALARNELGRFFERDWQARKSEAKPPVPPGEPIGQEEPEWLSWRLRQAQRQDWLKRHAQLETDCTQDTP